MSADDQERDGGVFGELSPPYSTIVADPPWPHQGFAGAVGRGGFFAGSTERARVKVKPLPYSSMTVDEIQALPVASLAAKDCWLFIWTTNRYMADVFDVFEAWGFHYRQTLVWHKTGNPMPLGGTLGPNHAEFLMVCSVGSPPVLDRIPSSVIAAQKPNVHSEKPAAFGDLIERCTPGPYVELFARAPRLGWDAWGRGYELVPQ